MSGSLKQIAPKKWLVQYDVFSADRRDRRTERIEGATKKEAEAYLADRRAELVAARKAYERGEVVKDAIPLSELFGRFMAAKQSKIEESTLRRYEIFVRCYLVPAFGERTGKTLHVQHLTDAYADWLANGRNGRTISPKTIRHIHETMRNILSWGVRYDWLSRNVATKIDSTDLPKAIKPKPKALTKDELRRLLDAAKHPTSQEARLLLGARHVLPGGVLLGVHRRTAKRSSCPALVRRGLRPEHDHDRTGGDGNPQVQGTEERPGAYHEHAAGVGDGSQATPRGARRRSCSA